MGPWIHCNHLTRMKRLMVPPCPRFGSCLHLFALAGRLVAFASPLAIADGYALCLKRLSPSAKR